VWYGGLSAVPNTNTMWPNGVVSLTFDDGYAAQYTVAKSYMDKYGYAGTEFPIIDLIGTANHLTLAQMKTMQQASGWDIGLHSWTAADHDIAGGFTALTTAQITRNIGRMREYLLNNGFYNPGAFAYPQGLWDLNTEAALLPTVGSARTVNPLYVETWPPSNRMRLRTKPMADTTTLANITALIDQIKANKEWLILTFHDIVASGPTSTGTTITIFQGIIDYLNTQGVAVRTVADVMAAQPGMAN
jgi:peptidoglycan/xylan/chitin deacetylase (PgdA/CDA1 family)